ncbi:MAG: hypothetical protein KAU41_04680 [Deltaproteobacteria bacterium]|nr:hypothetical protein [Deltaproteobacteria bacterium]
MARVTNITLNVGRAAGGQEFAEVEYDIQFSNTEVALNLDFEEWVMLFERDNDLDRYVETAEANTQVLRFDSGNDDYIGQVHYGAVRPDGNATVHRSHRREWSFPNNEAGREEYRSLVWVRPEIRAGRGWSNEVSINLA